MYQFTHKNTVIRHKDGTVSVRMHAHELDRIVEAAHIHHDTQESNWLFPSPTSFFATVPQAEREQLAATHRREMSRLAELGERIGYEYSRFAPDTTDETGADR